MKLLSYITPLFCLLWCQACERPFTEELRTIETWHLSYDDEKHAQNSLMGKPYKGSGFNRVDSARPYGDDLFYTLPDSLNLKDLRICIDGFIRSSYIRPRNTIAVSLDKDSILHWECFWLKRSFMDTGVWTHWSDSTQLPAAVNRVKGARLTVSAVYFGGKQHLDLDEMTITLKQVTRVNK